MAAASGAGGGDQRVCLVCFDELDDVDASDIFRCAAGHAFHFDCIVASIRYECLASTRRFESLVDVGGLVSRPGEFPCPGFGHKVNEDPASPLCTVADLEIQRPEMVGRLSQDALDAFIGAKCRLAASEAVQVHQERLDAEARAIQAEGTVDVQAALRRLAARQLVAGQHVPCPGCGLATRKDPECMHMTCSQCRVKFCYVCGSRRPCPNGCESHSIYLHNNPVWSELGGGAACVVEFHVRRMAFNMRCLMEAVHQMVPRGAAAWTQFLAENASMFKRVLDGRDVDVSSLATVEPPFFGRRAGGEHKGPAVADALRRGLADVTSMPSFVALLGSTSAAAGGGAAGRPLQLGAWVTLAEPPTEDPATSTAALVTATDIGVVVGVRSIASAHGVVELVEVWGERTGVQSDFARAKLKVVHSRATTGQNVFGTSPADAIDGPLGYGAEGVLEADELDGDRPFRVRGTEGSARGFYSLREVVPAEVAPERLRTRRLPPPRTGAYVRLHPNEAVVRAGQEAFPGSEWADGIRQVVGAVGVVTADPNEAGVEVRFGNGFKHRLAPAVLARVAGVRVAACEDTRLNGDYHLIRGEGVFRQAQSGAAISGGAGIWMLRDASGAAIFRAMGGVAPPGRRWSDATSVGASALRLQYLVQPDTATSETDYSALEAAEPTGTSLVQTRPVHHQCVRVIDSANEVEQLARGHGGWNSSMAASCGRVGSIRSRDTGSGSVSARVGDGASWAYNPRALQPVCEVVVSGCGEASVNGSFVQDPRRMEVNSKPFFVRLSATGSTTPHMWFADGAWCLGDRDDGSIVWRAGSSAEGPPSLGWMREQGAAAAGGGGDGGTEPPTVRFAVAPPFPGSDPQALAAALAAPAIVTTLVDDNIPAPRMAQADAAIAVDTLARIVPDAAHLEELQGEPSAGGFVPDMAATCGLVGRVRAVNDSTATVHTHDGSGTDRSFQYNRAALAPVPHITVSGCGMGEFNGDYVPDGSEGGRLRFRKRGGAQQTMNLCGSIWYMCHNHSGNWYTAPSQAEVPPTTGWRVGSNGRGSPPTLSYPAVAELAELSTDAPRTIAPDAMVLIGRSVTEVRRLQDGHGGWNPSMAATCGLVGRVTSGTHRSQQVRVHTHEDGGGDRSFVYNPRVLTPISHILVTGCGMDEFNGEYVPDGTASSRLRFRKRGGGRQTMNLSDGYWYMCRNHSGSWYRVRSQAEVPPTGGWETGSNGSGTPPMLSFVPAHRQRTAAAIAAAATTTTAAVATPAAGAGIAPDQMVRIIADEARVRSLQEGHGGWNARMGATCGQIGRVTRGSASSTHVRVVTHLADGNERAFVYNPAALTPVPHIAVTGCGMREFNGDYVPDGTASSRLRFRKRGDGQQTMNFSNGYWYMCHDHSGSWYRVRSQAGVPPIRGWERGSNGRGNAPTLRFAASVAAELPEDAPRTIAADMLVRVMSDPAAVQRLQDGHGGWSASMTATCGLVGRVTSGTQRSQHVTVHTHEDGGGDRSFVYNPRVLTPISHILVTGCGMDEFNGEYVPDGSEGGRLRFRKRGGAQQTMNLCGDSWFMCHNHSGSWYTAASRAEVPPTTGWVRASNGRGAPPTLTFVTVAGPPATAPTGAAAAGGAAASGGVAAATAGITRGSMVRIVADPHELERLQTGGHGGWSAMMAPTCGLVGRVSRGTASSDAVRVVTHQSSGADRSYLYNPAALTPVPHITVTGCGMDEFNGEYVPDGTASSRIRFRKRGGGRQTMNLSNDYWYMCHNHSGSWYRVRSQAEVPPISGWETGSNGRGAPPSLSYDSVAPGVAELSPGARVRVRDGLRAFMEATEGLVYLDDMAACQGQPGAVVSIGADGETVFVDCGEHGQWFMPRPALEVVQAAAATVPAALTAPPAEGGRVVIAGNAEELCESSSVGWVAAMAETVGQEGVVLSVDTSDESARVSVGELTYWYTWSSLRPASAASGGARTAGPALTFAACSDGMRVRIRDDARQAFEGSSLSFTEQMGEQVGQVGQVVRTDASDNTVQVDVNGSTWWWHPAALERA